MHIITNFPHPKSCIKDPVKPCKRPKVKLKIIIIIP